MKALQVAAVRAATAKAVELRRALPLGFLSRYTSRRKTIATARALVSTYVAQDFADFDARLRLRKSDYAKVWAYFEAEAHAHFNRSLSVYAGVKGAEAGKATERQRQADARFLEHRCGPLAAAIVCVCARARVCSYAFEWTCMYAFTISAATCSSRVGYRSTTSRTSRSSPNKSRRRRLGHTTRNTRDVRL